MTAPLGEWTVTQLYPVDLNWTIQELNTTGKIASTFLHKSRGKSARGVSGIE